jgi:hypothetical protein
MRRSILLFRTSSTLLGALLFFVACSSSNHELEKRVAVLEHELAEVRDDRKEVERKLDQLMMHLIEKPAATSAADTTTTSIAPPAKPTPAKARPAKPRPAKPPNDSDASLVRPD